MLLFDATHTSHTHAQTGIQRVCRSLFAELGRQQAVTGVGYDPHQQSWRALVAGELARLQPGAPAARSRGAKWPLHQRVTGHARRWLGLTGSLPVAEALVCPELFSAKIGAHLPEILARVNGPRVAVFFDALPLQLPELTPPATVARFPAYLRELLLFDGIAAISEESRAGLTGYWDWLGVVNPPPVTAIPLGVDPVDHMVPAGPAAGPARPVVLSIGTLEGRKNHLALLAACDQLWQRGRDFELRLIGHVNAETGGGALARVRALQDAGRPLRYGGPATDAEIGRAYAACAFTVYPSLAEGFGLPVIESLARGKPCICSARGALGESARGGGCLALDAVDPMSLAGAIERLLTHPAELATLTIAARGRTFKTWAGYARELTAWMQNLPRR